MKRRFHRTINLSLISQGVGAQSSDSGGGVLKWVGYAAGLAALGAGAYLGFIGGSMYIAAGAAAGGALTVAATSALSQKPDPLMTLLQRISKLDEAFHVNPGYERFEDPVFSVFGKDATFTPSQAADEGNLYLPPEQRLPYVIYTKQYAKQANGGTVKGPPTPTGYEYLSTVPNTAAARIDAIMKFKRTPFPKDGGEDGGRSTAFFKASQKALSDFTRSLIGTYDKIEKTPKDVDELARAYGVSSHVVQDEAKHLLDYANKLGSDAASNSAFLKEAYSYWGPVAKTVAASVEAASMALSGGGGQKQVAEAVLDILAEAALIVPAIGPLISIGLSFVSTNLKEGDAAEAAWCRDTQSRIWSRYDEAVKLGLPVPWHATQVFSAACPSGTIGADGYDDSAGQRALLHAFGTNLEYGSKLAPVLRASMQRWWALALIYWSDPQVAPIFNNLCSDSTGGLLASDEQVVAVAAPIAVSYGLDVVDFAKRLWVLSGGWKGADKNVLTHYSYMVDKPGDEKNLVLNALWVQWGVLARDAFDLADQLKGRVKPKTMLGDPKTLAKVTVWKPDVAKIDRPILTVVKK